MAQKDKMMYFNARARGEPIRMAYALADQKLIDERVPFEEWPSRKSETPLGQVPVFSTGEGVLIHSNTISRYVAKKFGLVGEGLWNEALNDVIVESLHEAMNKLATKVLLWKIFKRVPEPENSDKVIEEMKSELLKTVDYLKIVSEKEGKAFLLSDKIQLADLWLYNTLEFFKSVFPDAMEITPWVKEFTAKFSSDPKMKKYLAERPDTSL